MAEFPSALKGEFRRERSDTQVTDSGPAPASAPDMTSSSDGASNDGVRGQSDGADPLAVQPCVVEQTGSPQEAGGVDPACGGRQNPAPGPRADTPVVIPADASLLDGLRALLVHHLKRSAGGGSDVLSLSASQAELLEHHLCRLASYAVKIVNTLAFATRFSAMPPGTVPATSATAVSGSVSQASTGPPSSQIAAGISQQAAGSAEARPVKKTLKLNDREIMKLYRAAQHEAAVEADWRGIDVLTSSMRTGKGVAKEKSRSWRSSGARHTTQDDSAAPRDSAHRNCVQMLSRAMQQPGFNPDSLAAEIVQPPQEMSCCKPSFEVGEPCDSQYLTGNADHDVRNLRA